MAGINRQKIEGERPSSGKVWQTGGTANHGWLLVMAMVYVAGGLSIVLCSHHRERRPCWVLNSSHKYKIAVTRGLSQKYL